MTQSYNDGAFVFSRSRGLSPMDPDDAKQKAAAYGLPESQVPSYRGDYNAMMRAVDRVARSHELKKQGLKLEEVFASKGAGEIVYGIVAVTVTGKDLAAMKQTLQYDHQFSVGWSKLDPAIVTGEHGIAKMVRDQLGRFRGKITGDDWQDSIRQYLLSDAVMGAKVRSDGRVYWVPPQRLDVVRQYGKFLEQLGIDLIIVEVQPEHVQVVREIAEESLGESLSDLELEIQRFETTEPRRSTLEHRLNEYAALRDRANFYKAAMGAGMEKSMELLQSLEDRVNAMLHLTPRLPKQKAATLDAPADAPAQEPGRLPMPMAPVALMQVPQVPQPLPMPSQVQYNLPPPPQQWVALPTGLVLPPPPAPMPLKKVS